MSDRRQALGRGLGALIPTETAPAQRPVDVFFRERAVDPLTDHADHEAPSWERSPDEALDLPGEAEAGRTHGVSVRADRVTDDAADAGVPPDEPPPLTVTYVRTGIDGYPVEGPQDLENLGLAGNGSGEPAVYSREYRGDPAHVGQSEGLTPVPGARYAEIPVQLIRPNPRQPRTVFDPDELAELAYSIREVGMLQPVVVRPLGVVGETAPQHDVYELVMGERRWRAAIAAGLLSVPAIVKETRDDAMLRDALLENLHRAQLNPLEEAAAYQQLLDDFGCSKEELSTRIGRSRPQVSNTLRLLKLPPLVQRRVAAGVLSAGHARALLPLENAVGMERLAQRIVAEGLSVRTVEEIVSVGQQNGAARSTRTRAPVRNLDDVAGQLSDRFDTRVHVAMSQRKGRIVIEFAGSDDLERILGILG